MRRLDGIRMRAVAMAACASMLANPISAYATTYTGSEPPGTMTTGDVAVIVNADTVGNAWNADEQIEKAFDEAEDKLTNDGSTISTDEGKAIKQLFGVPGSDGTTDGMSKVIDAMSNGKTSAVLTQEEYNRLLEEMGKKVSEEQKEKERKAKEAMERAGNAGDAKKIKDDLALMAKGIDPKTGKPFDSNAADDASVQPNTGFSKDPGAAQPQTDALDTTQPETYTLPTTQPQGIDPNAVKPDDDTIQQGLDAYREWVNNVADHYLHNGQWSQVPSRDATEDEYALDEWIPPKDGDPEDLSRYVVHCGKCLGEYGFGFTCDCGKYLDASPLEAYATNNGIDGRTSQQRFDDFMNLVNPLKRGTVNTNKANGATLYSWNDGYLTGENLTWSEQALEQNGAVTDDYFFDKGGGTQEQYVKVTEFVGAKEGGATQELVDDLVGIALGEDVMKSSAGKDAAVKSGYCDEEYVNRGDYYTYLSTSNMTGKQLVGILGDESVDKTPLKKRLVEGGYASSVDEITDAEAVALTVRAMNLGGKNSSLSDVQDQYPQTASARLPYSMMPEQSASLHTKMKKARKEGGEEAAKKVAVEYFESAGEGVDGEEAYESYKRIEDRVYPDTSSKEYRSTVAYSQNLQNAYQATSNYASYGISYAQTKVSDDDRLVGVGFVDGGVMTVDSAKGEDGSYDALTPGRQIRLTDAEFNLDDMLPSTIMKSGKSMAVDGSGVYFNSGTGLTMSGTQLMEKTGKDNVEDALEAANDAWAFTGDEARQIVVNALKKKYDESEGDHDVEAMADEIMANAKDGKIYVPCAKTDDGWFGSGVFKSKQRYATVEAYMENADFGLEDVRYVDKYKSSSQNLLSGTKTERNLSKLSVNLNELLKTGNYSESDLEKVRDAYGLESTGDAKDYLDNMSVKLYGKRYTDSEIKAAMEANSDIKTEDEARAYLNEQNRVGDNVRDSLISNGMTPEEADAAISLVSSSGEYENPRDQVKAQLINAMETDTTLAESIKDTAKSYAEKNGYEYDPDGSTEGFVENYLKMTGWGDGSEVEGQNLADVSYYSKLGVIKVVDYGEVYNNLDNDALEAIGVPAEAVPWLYPTDSGWLKDPTPKELEKQTNPSTEKRTDMPEGAGEAENSTNGLTDKEKAALAGEAQTGNTNKPVTNKDQQDNLDSLSGAANDYANSEEYKNAEDEVFNGTTGLGTATSGKTEWSGVQAEIIKILRDKYGLDNATLNELISTGVVPVNLNANGQAIGPDGKVAYGVDGKPITIQGVINGIDDYIAGFTAISDKVTVSVTSTETVTGTRNVDVTGNDVYMGMSVTITGPNDYHVSGSVFTGGSYSFMPVSGGDYVMTLMSSYADMAYHGSVETVTKKVTLVPNDGSEPVELSAYEYTRRREDQAGMKMADVHDVTRSYTIHVTEAKMKEMDDIFFGSQRVY